MLWSSRCNDLDSRPSVKLLFPSVRSPGSAAGSGRHRPPLSPWDRWAAHLSYGGPPWASPSSVMEGKVRPPPPPLQDGADKPFVMGQIGPLRLPNGADKLSSPSLMGQVVLPPQQSCRALPILYEAGGASPPSLMGQVVLPP